MVWPCGWREAGGSYSYGHGIAGAKSWLCPSPALASGHQPHHIVVRMNEGTSVWVVVLYTGPRYKLGPRGGAGGLIKDDSWDSGLRKWVGKSEMTQRWARQVLR